MDPGRPYFDPNRRYPMPRRNTGYDPTGLTSDTVRVAPPMSASGSSVTVKTERGREYDDSPEEANTSGDGGRVKKKQKRNKPTLSCQECVERKTKVGFTRAHPKSTCPPTNRI